MKERKRHIPQRICIICRRKKPKAELTRFVLDKDNKLICDRLQKMPGRGAYICQNFNDISQCKIIGALKRAYKKDKVIIPFNISNLSVTSNKPEVPKF